MSDNEHDFILGQKGVTDIGQIVYNEIRRTESRISKLAEELEMFMRLRWHDSVRRRNTEIAALEENVKDAKAYHKMILGAESITIKHHVKPTI